MPARRKKSPRRRRRSAEGRTSQQRRPAQGECKATLYLMRGLEGLGFLLLVLSNGATAVAKLNAAQVRLLYALHLARREDSDLPPPMRGWRNAEQLGKAVGDLLDDRFGVDSATVVTYVSRLNRHVRKAIDDQLGAASRGAPDLVQSERGMGYRLEAWDLIVIDRSQPQPTSAAASTETPEPRTC